ncbi:MAG TPA: hypothetical protein VE621_21565 [Bryobacteraceae bacterium]|nr:hypothetical protein [Bryobacteraceae bacterium]
MVSPAPAKIDRPEFEVLLLDVDPSTLSFPSVFLQTVDFGVSKSVEEAVDAIRSKQYPVVLCRDDAAGGGWQALLQRVQTMPDPPTVVVYAGRQDPITWTRVLTSGGFDVVWASNTPDTTFRTLQAAFERRRRNMEIVAARKRCVRSFADSIATRAYA